MTAQGSLFAPEAELQDVLTLDYDHGAPGDRLRVCASTDGARVVLFVVDAKGQRKGNGVRLTPTQAGCLGNGLLLGRKRALELADAQRGRR